MHKAESLQRHFFATEVTEDTENVALERQA